MNDWGQSFGAWGRFSEESIGTASLRKSDALIRSRRKEGIVQFGYGGAHTADFKNDITLNDVRWLMKYLGRMTDAQLRAGFQAPALPDEEECFKRDCAPHRTTTANHVKVNSNPCYVDLPKMRFRGSSFRE